MDALNNSATEQRQQVAILWNERKVTKLQVHMRDREISHLEGENERDRIEAEKIHERMMERKRMDIEVLREEAKLMTLKVQLAQLNAGGPASDTTPGSSSIGFSSTVVPGPSTGHSSTVATT